LDGDAVVLETDGTEYRVPLDQIESARLVVEL
jgi:ribosome maturation factor RimP